MNILQVNSSARTFGSHSSNLATSLVRRLLDQNREATLILRDLGCTPHPCLDEAALRALFTPAAERTPEQAARVAMDDVLIAEIQAADVVVLGVPMYNHGISVQLKCWIDAISRAQITFRYDAHGAQGLLTGKKVYVMLARGGIYRDTAADTQTPYLQRMLNFLGMQDIEFIHAEGLALGPEAEKAALDAAYEKLKELVPA